MYKSYDELPLTMNVLDVAKALGVSRGAAYNLLNSSDFPTIHIGTRLLVGKNRFIEWMEKQSVKETA